MALGRARVQLLNPDTGAVVQEVDVLSTAAVISYINDKATTRDFRGIPAGTSFKEEDEVSVQDILDSILYPYQEMELQSIASVDGKDISEDTIIYKEKFYPVEGFTYSAKIKVGDIDTLTFSLKRYDNNSGEVTTMTDTITVVAGSEYMYTKDIDEITSDTTLQLTITDGTNIIASPSVEFKFIYPVYVGYCDLSQFISENDSYEKIIDTQAATDYFNTLITNKSQFIEKRVIPIQNVQGICVSDPLYSHKKLHPCILYPNTWHKVESIIDCNGDIITGSYLYNNQLSIKPDNNEVHKVQYSVYAALDDYYVQLAATEEIVYQFVNGDGSIDYTTVGVPSIVGFERLNHHPLDIRLEVNTYDELREIEYTYDGMTVFVLDIHSYFRYDKPTDLWVSTNQEFLFGNTIPSLDIGKSGDIYINLSTGHIYQKYQDIRWEDKGVITVNLSEDILQSIDKWQEGKTYEEGEYVFWNDKYWKATETTTSEPGTDTTWIETKPTTLKGADGEPGEAATIEIADVLVTDNVDDADVINLGDKFHARLRFILPRGEKGDPGDVATGDGSGSATNNQIKELEKKILQLQNQIEQLSDAQIKLQYKMVATGTDITNNILNFTNSDGDTIFSTVVPNSIPIMINGELDYTNAKTAYIEEEDETDYYIMKFL